MDNVPEAPHSNGTNQILKKENCCSHFSQVNGFNPPSSPPPPPPPSTTFPPSTSQDHTAVIPDGGYGWVVAFASMWCNGCILGIHNSFSILHMMLIEGYEESGDQSQFKVAWVGALSMGMMFFCSPVVSIFTDRFGCRNTAVGGALVAFAGLLASSFASSLSLYYFTYGILFGCGSSFAFQPSLVILGHYFRRRLGLASGVVTAASSLFTMGFPVLLEEAVTPLGLGTTFQVLSIFLLIQVPLSLTFRPLPSAGPHRRAQPASSSPEGNAPSPPIPGPDLQGGAGLRKYFNLKVFGVTTYRQWLFGVAVATLGYFVPVVHLISFAEEKFKGTQKVWILLIYVGGSSCVGRLIFGKAIDLIGGVKKLFLQAASFVVMGVVLATFPLCRTFEALVAACLLQGLCDGCFLSCMAPIVFELVDQRMASQAIGYLLGFLALPMIVGPPIAGLLHDHFGNYDVAFHLTGVPIVVGGLQLFLVPFIHWRAQGYEPEHGTSSEPVPTLSANIADRSFVQLDIFFLLEKFRVSTLLKGNTGGAKT
ncbi:monocarboxylate transporter 8-like isoform X1 [Scleropages formosus]|uniref:monocarboxylate transporter 8-like isoform X1 n=1 Tax=Scleropages formosus TaxID=113540 RepID=UPI0010FA8F5F|nr:monocarboxylate transporter 8-like isoform X1 [Scleropages formosus]